MSKQDNGGPAFPVTEEAIVRSMTGASLRDIFAMAWMQGFVANPNTPDMAIEPFADHAYRMADAMLIARSK